MCAVVTPVLGSLSVHSELRAQPGLGSCDLFLPIREEARVLPATVQQRAAEEEL